MVRLHGAFGASNVEAVYTHWGSAFKAAAQELGLPVGSYAAPDRLSPHYRKPSEPPFELPTPPSGSCPPRRDSPNEIGEADLLDVLNTNLEIE